MASPNVLSDAPGNRGVFRSALRTISLVGLALLLALAFLVLTSDRAVADTPKAGNIMTDETWTAGMSPIWVEGNINVMNGSTLTIDPGVEVRFDGYYSITVENGALIADGDPAGAGPVTFTSNSTFPSAGNWYGIVFNANGAGASVLDDVVIEYASYGITFNGASTPLQNVTIRDTFWYGIYVSGGSADSLSVSAADCTIEDVGIYGVYVTFLSTTDLTLQMSDCTFSGYGTAGLAFGGFSGVDVDITVEGSSFNASNRAVYFTGTSSGDIGQGNAFRLTFRDNWLNSTLDSYGVYMPYDIQYFQETALVFEGNRFWAQGGRSYGVYLDDFWSTTDAAQSFSLEVRDNEFRDFLTAGVYLDSTSNFRTHSLTVAGNLFENTDAIYMDYGVYVWSVPYYTSDLHDTSLTIVVEGNTARDLSWAAVYLAAGSTDGYRNVALTVQWNVIENTGTTAYMDYGVWFQHFQYNDFSVPTHFSLTVDGNAVENLDDYAVYFSSGVSGFRNVSVDVTNNRFENVDVTWMDSGVYFISTPSYTTSHDGFFGLTASGNQFLNVSSYAIRFSSISSFTDVSVDVDGNDFSGSYYGLYLPGGVDSAETLVFRFTNNTGEEVDNYALYATGFLGISLAQSQADFEVSGNTISDTPYGLYLGSITDYDLSNSVVVANNVLTDVDNEAILLDWHDRTNSRVVVRDNTVTGRVGTAIHLEGFEDQSAQVDILSNTIQGADRGIAVDYAGYDAGDVTLTIADNSLLDITGEGIYVYEVYEAAAFITIENNVVVAASDAFFSASLLHFDSGSGGWYRSLADLDIRDNTLDGGLHGIYFYGTYGYGTTVLLDVQGVTAVNTAFGITLDFPAGHAADIMNVVIRDSTFRENQRGFLSLNEPGLGLLPVDIQNVQALEYGGWGGYAFYMGDNDGAQITVEVRGSTFQAASGSLGDVYAGSGPITMNFYYIDGILDGVANDPEQRIRVLWKVDVQVLKGRNLDVPATGVVVFAEDQFGVRSFTAVTDGEGWVRNQWISGVIIAYGDGTSYAGPAVQSLVAEWGPFNGTTAASFTSNGTATVYLPGDHDGDGLNDLVDPDDDNDGIADTRDANPLASGFMDFATNPYFFHLWVLVGLVGLVALPLARLVWSRTPPSRKGGTEDEWEPPEEPPLPP